MLNRLFSILLTAFVLFTIATPVQASGEGEDVDYGAQVMHHISDANEFHFWGDIHLPLPIIAWSKSDGFHFGLSSDFYGHGESHAAPAHDDHAGHGHEGHDHSAHDDHGHDAGQAGGHEAPHANKVINGYFLDHGVLRRLSDPSARASVESLSAISLKETTDGESRMLISGGKSFAVANAASLFDVANINWIDFSITKNVATMLMAALVFALIFGAVRKGYKTNQGRAPKGIQSFFEPIILFIRDDIAKEMIGPKWEKYFPYLATLFFFILLVNLFGLIPIAPFGANATGNVALTFALAVVTFFVVNLSGNRDYWGHIFWMPGVPTLMKIVLAPIELIGIFVKPFTLMIRLFANISAGHIIILSLIGLIFQFGNNGASVGGSAVGALIAVPFTLVMNILELFVAFLQAFIFTLLSALYIGAAVEEHHHADHDEEHAPKVPA